MEEVEKAMRVCGSVFVVVPGLGNKDNEDKEAENAIWVASD